MVSPSLAVTVIVVLPSRLVVISKLEPTIIAVAMLGLGWEVMVKVRLSPWKYLDRSTFWGRCCLTIVWLGILDTVGALFAARISTGKVWEP